MRIGFALTSFALVSVALIARVAADDYAPTMMTAAQILAKADTAAGNLVPGQYLVVKRSGSGANASTQMTQINGADFVTIVQDGPFTQSYGSYHGQRWYRDANGTVVREIGFHETSDPDALAWSHPDDPLYRVRVLGMTQTPPLEYVLDANPPGGEDEYRYYDARTFSFARDVLFASDRNRYEIEYSQYRSIFGETIPFREHDSDGNPSDDEDMQTVSFARVASQNPLTIPDSQPLFSLRSTPVTLPVSFTDDGTCCPEIVVHTTIGGQQVDFTLDSGASGLYIDTNAVRRLGLTTHGQGSATIGGTFSYSQTIVPEMSVGGIQMHNVAFTVSPMPEGSRTVGLLGCDFLASAVVGIDLKNAKVTLIPWASFNAAALGVQAMPIEMDDCVPRVAASFENVPGAFLLDTGDFATMLYPHYVAKLPRAGVASTGETADTQFGAGTLFSAVGGSVHSKFYDVSNFIFGGIQYRVGQVIVPDRTSTFQDPDYDGIIGRNVLKEYVFYLDYNDDLMFIKPNV
ncbi:MAG TPA: aspartyl protease family protein [Candidatus Tyrphobacter sp.]